MNRTIMRCSLMKKNYIYRIKTTREKEKKKVNMSTVGFVLLLIRKSSFPTLSISICGPFEL